MRSHRASIAVYTVGVLLCLALAYADPLPASVAPFWPEENCQNAIALGSQADLPSSTALSPFSAEFEGEMHTGGSYAGPSLHDSTTPCRLKAHIGQPMAFNVYAEDVDPGDTVRIYVLEDPGIPNNAVMLRDEYYQRCVPTAGGAVIDGGSLGPCPMCQNSGEVTYGAKHAPAVPEGDMSMATFIGNVSAADPTFLPVENRVWCAASSDGRAYGDGKAEPAAEHGRLVRRKFAWTPLPAQGVCDHATECVYVVRVQAFEIAVQKAKPQYSYGSYGLVLGGQTVPHTDAVTGRASTVSNTTFAPVESGGAGDMEWMRPERNYNAYINCPLELAIGVFGGNYDVTLRISSPILPPSATVEWREAQAECGDRQHASYLRGAGRFTDKDGNTCEDYVSNGWCANGGVGPRWGESGFASFRAAARSGLLSAAEACCACGAGSPSPCAARATQELCESAAAEGELLYPNQVCKWDGASRCFGQTHPYFITPGGLHEGWDVAEREPVGRRVMGIFSWTPLRGMEGQRHRVCFRGGDAAGSAQLPEVCTYIGVAKCKYCARVGETLKYVAEQYNFDTNWMRLWNYNPEIEDPDHLIRSFLPITIGSTYRVQPGDTLSRVAARLRTTVKKVMEVNPDMTSDELEAGQEVCIMPCTENPYKDDPYNPYNPAGINGLDANFLESVPRLSKDPPFH